MPRTEFTVDIDLGVTTALSISTSFFLTLTNPCRTTNVVSDMHLNDTYTWFLEDADLSDKVIPFGVFSHDFSTHATIDCGNLVYSFESVEPD